MLQLLYELIYVMLLIIPLINFPVAQIMVFLGIGESKILAPLLGSAVGWLLVWVAPTSMAGLIVSIIATIASNLVLTHIVYPKR